VIVSGIDSIEKLAAHHDTSQFDCGKEALNRFLRRFALVNQAAHASQTYVLSRTDRTVVAYYSLAVGAVEHAATPSRIGQGLARHAVPVMLLARLAIDRPEQKRGFGKALLKDALLRTAQAADIAGIRALLVHAKDEDARAWYMHFDFEPSPTDPFHLYLLMKDIKALTES
jgi:GNAT superfamily N-acetyltransferase